MGLCVKAPITIPNHPSSFKWFGNIPRAIMQSHMAMDCLQDLWCSHTKGWSAHGCMMLDLVLTPTTWWRYQSSLIHFHNFCE